MSGNKENQPTATTTTTTTPAVKHDNRPWVEKYRPTALEDIVCHEQILETLTRLMNHNALPHLLFYGSPGTGKTSTINVVARYLFGNSIKGNVLEMNASDDRGIDIVRNEIKDFASTGQVFSWGSNKGAVDSSSSSTEGTTDSATAPRKQHVKLVILDEADQMSGEAQAALRRVIEKYTKTVRFCIICNHVNKIIPAIQSRCTRFRFAPVKKTQILPRLVMITETEKIKTTDDGLAAAFRLSNGDLRRCINTMQAASLAFGEISENSVYRSCGNPTPSEVHHLIQVMVGEEFPEAWRQIQPLVQKNGMSTVDLVREVHPYVVKMDVPVGMKCFVLEKLAEIEYYLSTGTGESTALAAVLGTMQLMKEGITRAPKNPVVA